MSDEVESTPSLPSYGAPPTPTIQKPGALHKLMTKMMKPPKVRVKAPTTKTPKKKRTQFY